MGKNVSESVYAEAVAAREAGRPMAEVMADFDLSHSQLELACMRLSDDDSIGGMKSRCGTEEATPKNVVRLRQLAGRDSAWARIGMLCGIPESRVRKLWTEGGGLKSQGQRIGRGGRFYYGDNGQPLYLGDLKATGTAIRPDEKGLEGALAAADEQRNLVSEPDEVVWALYAKLIGRNPARGSTKAQVIRAIRAAEAAQAPKPKAPAKKRAAKAATK